MSSCTSCLVKFADHTEMREHFKSDWHVYNSRRKLAGLVPITQDAWHAKWAQMNAKKAAEKGTAHLKAKDVAAEKVERRRPSAEVSEAPQAEAEPKDPVEFIPFEPGHCLFDARRFRSVKNSLEYMSSKYSFFIPDREYLVSEELLLERLAEKIHEDHQCIFCNKRFPTLLSVRNHMIDKGHTRIGTDTDELEADIEDCYDYSRSVAETKLKTRVMRDKAQELAVLKEGSDEEEEEEDSSAESGSDEAEWEDLPSDGEVIEVDDEDEFQRIMDELGLRRAEITDSGDLQLPDGSVAVHRDFAYIYKQRNMAYRASRRPANKQAALEDGSMRAGLKRDLVTNGGGTMVKAHPYWSKCATRSEKRDQKAVTLLLRADQHKRNKLAVYGCMKGPKWKRRMDQNMPHFMKG